mgnify:CR=1 FL=1
MAEKTSNEYQIAIKLLPLVGGVTNIDDVTNCMTRLRLKVKDGSKVKVDDIKKVPGVLGLISDGTLYQIVLGPGKVRKVTEEFNALVKTAQEVAEEVHKEENKVSQETKEKPITGNAFVRFFKRIGRFLKGVKWKRGLRHIGNIFSPLVPGFICFGIFYSITTIILVASGGGTVIKPEALTGAAAVFYWIFYALAFGFMTYLSVFVGINSAKEFNATPTLGGILGGIAIIPKVLEIAKLINWAGPIAEDGSFPLALIDAGRGGVFTVIFAVFIMSFIERLVRKKMPNVLDTVFSPLLILVISGLLLLFAIMPVMGFVSNGIAELIAGFNGLDNWARAICGFFLAGLFLPLVMLGLHHGLTSIYMTMMENNILYPIFAMADAAQFGVGMAILIKSRKYKHDRLKENAAAGVIPQALGVSEPLIYGVTLPLFKPFITVGIGAAIGGAFIAAMGIGFNGFDVSGLLGILLASKIDGVDAPIMARVWYFVGWLISAAGGFISTWLMIGEKDLNRLPRYDTFVNKA